MRRVLAAVIVALALLLTSGCEGAGSGPVDFHLPPPPTSLAKVPMASAANDPYAAAVAAAVHRHLEVWIETDLVKHWLQGPQPFYAAVRRVAALAERRGVTGIKIADELGYHDGLRTPAQVQAFLDDAARALHSVVPNRKILVDMVLPELGCVPSRSPAPLPGTISCAARERALFPMLALTRVDGYLASGDIDVLDLSMGLRDESFYAYWGVTREEAAQAAWREALRRGWQRHVVLNARKALAHPGVYADGSAGAATDVHLFLDLPLQGGAHAVDVWTWRQVYKGQVYRLLDPGLQPNALWAALLERHHRGDRLFTHLSPHSTEVGLDTDLDALAKVFSGVFVAAGTG